MNAAQRHALLNPLTADQYRPDLIHERWIDRGSTRQVIILAVDR